MKYKVQTHFYQYKNFNTKICKAKRCPKMKNISKKFQPRPLEGGYQQMKKMAQNKRPKTKDLAPQLAPQFNPSSLAKKLVLSKSFRHQLEEGEYGPNVYENSNKKYIIKSNSVQRSNSASKVSSHIKINSFKKSPQTKENIKRAGIGADFYTPKKKKENIKNIHPSTPPFDNGEEGEISKLTRGKLSIGSKKPGVKYVRRQLGHY